MCTPQTLIKSVDLKVFVCYYRATFKINFFSYLKNRLGENMGIINALNGMRIYEREQDLISFRTSRAERILGCFFLLMGLAMSFYLLVSKFLNDMRSFCVFGFLVALFFMLIGFVLVTHKKNVLVDKRLRRIEIEESCPLGCRLAVIHFDEIVKFELAKGFDKIIVNDVGVWVVKAYVKSLGSNSFTTEKVYHSMSLQETQEVAELLSYACNKEVIMELPRKSVALKIA